MGEHATGYALDIFFNNNKLISLAHYIQQTIHYGMMYSIDLPVGVSKSVADTD